MAEDTDEFAYLAEEAREVGAPLSLPRVKRTGASTSGGTVSAIVWGDAPAVTLLHGAGLNAHTWDSTLLALGVSAIAVDLPGHGDSEWRDDFDYGPRTNATAVAAVLDQLAPGKPQTIVGQSLGGLTAIALTEARPDLVDALVLVDVSPGLRPGDATQVRDFLAGPQVFASREDIVEKALAAGIGSSRTALERGVVLNTRIRDDGAVVFKHHLANPPAGATALPSEFGDLWAGVTHSDVPVLLVRGSHGFLSSEVVDEFRAKVPRASVIEIDAGHNVQEQRPAELAATIAELLG